MRTLEGVTVSARPPLFVSINRRYRLIRLIKASERWIGYRVSWSLEIRGNSLSEIKPPPPPPPPPPPLIGARRVRIKRNNAWQRVCSSRALSTAWTMVIACKLCVGATGFSRCTLSTLWRYCNGRRLHVCEQTGANRDSWLVRGAHDGVEMLHRRRGSNKYLIPRLEKNGIFNRSLLMAIILVSFFWIVIILEVANLSKWLIYYID